MDQSTSSPQQTIEVQKVGQEKIDVYSEIKNMVEDFLESPEFDDFFDGQEKLKILTKGDITITIDLSKFKR